MCYDFKNEIVYVVGQTTLQLIHSLLLLLYCHFFNGIRHYGDTWFDRTIFSNILPFQVKLLLELLRQESSTLVKERSVNCLYFLISGDASYFTAGIDDFSVMLLVTEDVELSLKYQYRGLRILQKVGFSSQLFTI